MGTVVINTMTHGKWYLFLYEAPEELSIMIGEVWQQETERVNRKLDKIINTHSHPWWHPLSSKAALW